jgi:hypothetical protein
MLGTSRSYRQLLVENFKAAGFMSEDALKHIELMPFTRSQIELPGHAEFVLLSGDRVYAGLDKTLYVYSVRQLTHPVATYSLEDRCRSAIFVEKRLYLG